MHMKKRIINIDESVINLTDSIKRGWLIKGVKNKPTTAKRLDHINIIAGISNYGDVFYTINHGMTNSDSFLLFVCKLCEHLNSVN